MLYSNDFGFPERENRQKSGMLQQYKDSSYTCVQVLLENLSAFSIKYFLVILFCANIPHTLYARSGAATYSEATDVFEIMDHVSLWHRSLPRTYRQAWEKKYPLSLEDRSYLDKYKDLRLKFHKGVQEGKDIFGEMPIGFDSFSEAFYSSKSVGEALKKLVKKKLSTADIKFLKTFYSYFKERISFFVKESTHFQVKLLDLNKRWKEAKISSYLPKYIKFVLGKQGRKVKVVLRPVWYPKGLKPRVDLRGPYLILRYHPLDSNNKWDITLYKRKAIEAIIQGQPANQRANLSQIFKEKCRGRGPDFASAIQVVFGEMLPASYKEKKKFNLYKRWHRKNFVDVYAKLLYPLAMKELKGREYFSGVFMENAAGLCRQVHDLAYVP